MKYHFFYVFLASIVCSTAFLGSQANAQVIHDAEYYILEAQNGKKWEAEDQGLNARLAELRKKHGQPPNIVYILWDDTTFGAVGFSRAAEELWF